MKRVMIANRGEIALRIARTLRELGIEVVAVYSDPDRVAPHVRYADYAYRLGPGPAHESYLDIDRLLSVAKQARVDGIHPGYGFLSENADFAERVTAAGIAFIGPPAEAMRVMGSKTLARTKMMSAGVPCVPGSEWALSDSQEALTLAKDLGYPVMLKASAGGGGKGMRLVHRAEELSSAFRAAVSEAENAFGDGSVFLEKAIVEPRHIEIQVFAGPDGQAISLGERECSMQRRHQKVIEESPSPLVDEGMRARMGEVACTAANAVQYVGAGTVEFIADRDRNFYFLEMNTRLQVEHPVTELCTGLDLVAWQVRVANGDPLPSVPSRTFGHAIEARIYAEDPDQGFLPSPGLIEGLRFPEGPGIRVDSGVHEGLEVPRFYDPMLAKVCSWGIDREQARRRLVRALKETWVQGITTNTRFLRALLESQPFISGSYHTGSIKDLQNETATEHTERALDTAALGAVVRRFRRHEERATKTIPESAGGSGWSSRSWRTGQI